MEKKPETGRVAYLDALRVFAALAVVLLHTSARGWDTADVMGSAWSGLNLYNGISRWCVPVFVMISGALYLPRDMQIKTIYTKYVRRMAIVYVLWAVIYVAVILVADLVTSGGFHIPWTTVAYEGIKGADHTWYIPMLIGLYMLLPLLRPMVKNMETAKYFLVLAFLFQLVLPQGVNLLRSFGPAELSPIVDALDALLNRFYLQLVMSFTGFFVAGYVLSQVKLQKKHRQILYALGAAGLVVTVLLNLAAARKINYPLETYLSCFNVNVAVTAAAIFVWFRHNVTGEGKLYPLVRKLSRYTFGVYLVHPFLLMILEILGINTLAFHPLLSVPVIGIAVTVGAFLVCYVLNKLPVTRKYLV